MCCACSLDRDDKITEATDNDREPDTALASAPVTVNEVLDHAKVCEGQVTNSRPITKLCSWVCHAVATLGRRRTTKFAVHYCMELSRG